LNREANLDGVYVETWELNGTNLRCMLSPPGALVDTQPLLTGVEAMNIRYGVDTGGDAAPDNYVAAAAVTNWASVRSVNIRLRLLSDDDNLTEAPTAYTNFTGGTITPTDRRLRRTLSTTVALRNILP
jgi:type IV pilus assembly protein PilW